MKTLLTGNLDKFVRSNQVTVRDSRKCATLDRKGRIDKKIKKNVEATQYGLFESGVLKMNNAWICMFQKHILLSFLPSESEEYQKRQNL